MSRRSIFALPLAVSLAACPVAPDDTGDTGELGPAYLLSQEIRTADSSEMLISILPSLDAQTVDRGAGLAVSGSARGVFAELGFVFVPNNEDLTLTRYAVAADRSLVDPLTLSFAGRGVTSLRDFYVFGAERAYAFNADGLVVVWNPTTMEIVEDTAIENFDRDGFLGEISLTGRDVNIAARDTALATGFLTLPVAWADFENYDAAPLAGVLSISITDASDQRIVTTTCTSQATWAVAGANDDLYVVGAPAWGPFYHHAPTDLPGSAFARFDTAARAFVDDACTPVTALTGGDQGGIALQYAPGRFLLRAIDEETASASTIDGYWGDIEYACSFYDGSIDEAGAVTLTAAPGMGVAGGCFGGVFGIDGAAYFNIPDEGFASGALARWTGASLEPILGLDGYPWSFERVR